MAILVAAAGYVLLNIAFIADFLFQGLIDKIVGQFTSLNVNRIWPWYPSVKYLAFFTIILILARFIFPSKIKRTYKVIFFTLLLTLIYTTIGIFLYRYPIISYLLCLYFFFGFLYFFIRKKQSWMYYYALILVSLTLLIFNFFGGQV